SDRCRHCLSPALGMPHMMYRNLQFSRRSSTAGGSAAVEDGARVPRSRQDARRPGERRQEAADHRVSDI
ncbi:hypothetical protein PENTCL1PPCAC_3508, partial [Pristionchus entomophagus]